MEPAELSVAAATRAHNYGKYGRSKVIQEGAQTGV